VADTSLIDRLVGCARLDLRRPTPHEVALVTDGRREGNAANDVTVFQDGELYRLEDPGPTG
jgi:hypothetical protein